jgi:hypothetical protein
MRAIYGPHVPTLLINVNLGLAEPNRYATLNVTSQATQIRGVSYIANW